MVAESTADRGARRAGLALVAILLFAAVAAVVPVQAQSTAVDTAAQRIFTRVMSPYCPGLLLADCPSPEAFTLRAEIRARLAAGEAPADIEQMLYDRFGDAIRAVPTASGWGLVLWVAPLVVFAASLGGLMWFLARSRADGSSPGTLTPTDPMLEQRLDEELDDLR